MHPRTLIVGLKSFGNTFAFGSRRRFRKRRAAETHDSRTVIFWSYWERTGRAAAECSNCVRGFGTRPTEGSKGLFP